MSTACLVSLAACSGAGNIPPAGPSTVYATQNAGSLYVVDAKKNAVFLVQGQKMHSGALYTEAPDDSGVITPLITDFGSPTGLVFAPSKT